MKPIYESEYLQLGLKIAYYRKLRGLTQEQLAEKIDRTPAFIGHVEAPNISKAVSLDTLFDIAAALDVPAYKFLIFEDD
ncbi:MAG: helix-turn-helix domain-containing protein [Agathobacter sp.]